MDIALAPDHQAQGLGCDAMRAMARFLFRTRGHHRVVIDPAAHNERAGVVVGGVAPGPLQVDVLGGPW
jgi:RimJ/RimL family protein N-acetyltransferase